MTRGITGTMRSRRPLSINNSLVHGICNYNCRLCGVNKPGYRGPREYQSRQVTERLIERVKQAARAGVRVRYIANSGDGEPTLLPGFRERMDLFGRLVREWSSPDVPPPEVAVVTNGSRLLEPDVLPAFRENRLTMMISFPTPVAGHYGQIMTGEAERGAALLEQVAPGIREAMGMAARGEIPKLSFHISPPERDIIREDFPQTVDFLTSRAREAGLGEVELVLFPATSNRSGQIQNRIKQVDFFKDFARAYDGRAFNGVRVRTTLSFKRFFPRMGEVLDLLRAFNLPCWWNAHLFITPRGDSICCNDQQAREPFGSIMREGIAQLMARKENHLPGELCAACDQRPDHMKGALFARCYARLARLRLAWARRKAPAPEEKPEPVLPLGEVLQSRMRALQLSARDKATRPAGRNAPGN